jgi:hypothetical protein
MTPSWKSTDAPVRVDYHDDGGLMNIEDVIGTSASCQKRTEIGLVSSELVILSEVVWVMSSAWFWAFFLIGATLLLTVAALGGAFKSAFGCLCRIPMRCRKDKPPASTRRPPQKLSGNAQPIDKYKPTGLGGGHWSVMPRGVALIEQR